MQIWPRHGTTKPFRLYTNGNQGQFDASLEEVPLITTLVITMPIPMCLEKWWAAVLATPWLSPVEDNLRPFCFLSCGPGTYDDDSCDYACQVTNMFSGHWPLSPGAWKPFGEIDNSGHSILQQKYSKPTRQFMRCSLSRNTISPFYW